MYRKQPTKWAMWMATPIGNLGIAIDEAILATVMVGGAGVFAAVSLPWETFFPTAEVRMITQMEAIEQANSKFHYLYHRWPHEMTNGSPNNNAAALVTRRALRFPFRSSRDFEPLLKDIPFSVDGNEIALRHDYGSGGRILQMPSDVPGYNIKLVMENVPMTKIKEFDVEIDEKASLKHGRLQADIRSSHTNMIYYANPK